MHDLSKLEEMATDLSISGNEEFGQCPFEWFRRVSERLGRRIGGGGHGEERRFSAPCRMALFSSPFFHYQNSTVEDTSAGRTGFPLVLPLSRLLPFVLIVPPQFATPVPLSKMSLFSRRIFPVV